MLRCDAWHRASRSSCAPACSSAGKHGCRGHALHWMVAERLGRCCTSTHGACAIVSRRALTRQEAHPPDLHTITRRFQPLIHACPVQHVLLWLQQSSQIPPLRPTRVTSVTPCRLTSSAASSSPCRRSTFALTCSCSLFVVRNETLQTHSSGQTSMAPGASPGRPRCGPRGATMPCLQGAMAPRRNGSRAHCSREQC